MAKSGVNPTNFERIPAYVPDSDDGLVHAVIETAAGTRQKYAFDPSYGILKLKLTLADGLAWPYDYGFVPQTMADDGDPVDILVLSEAPNIPGSLSEVRVLGVIRLKQDGEENDRLVAAPKRCKGIAQKADAYDDISDIPKETMSGIERFLLEYPEEHGKRIKITGTDGHKAALHAIDKGIKTFEKKRKTEQ